MIYAETTAEILRLTKLRDEEEARKFWDAFCEAHNMDAKEETDGRKEK